MKSARGVSSILFAMIFALVLSLLAVGFASLVQNDQRQTLDQSLGYQAQYAAETAINQTAAYLKSPSAPNEQTSCTASPYEVVSGTNVRVTCVRWDKKVESVVVDSLTAARPYATKFVPESSFNRLVVTWENDTSLVNTYGASSVLPSPINNSSYHSIIKITFMKLTDLGSSTPQTKSIYVVPRTGATGAATYNSFIDGGLASASCSGVQCSFTFNGMNLMGPGGSAGVFEGYISMTVIGAEAKNINLTALNASGAVVKVGESQFTIDATAIAQDVTKRVEARVPAYPTTWLPGYVTKASDRACKDIKIDGTNNTSISGDNSCVGLLN